MIVEYLQSLDISQAELYRMAVAASDLSRKARAQHKKVVLDVCDLFYKLLDRIGKDLSNETYKNYRVLVVNERGQAELEDDDIINRDVVFIASDNRTAYDPTDLIATVDTKLFVKKLATNHLLEYTTTGRVLLDEKVDGCGDDDTDSIYSDIVTPLSFGEYV